MRSHRRVPAKAIVIEGGDERFGQTRRPRFLVTNSDVIRVLGEVLVVTGHEWRELIEECLTTKEEFIAHLAEVARPQFQLGLLGERRTVTLERAQQRVSLTQYTVKSFDDFAGQRLDVGQEIREVRAPVLRSTAHDVNSFRREDRE